MIEGIPVLLAQSGNGGQGGGGLEGLLSLAPPMILMLVIFYFILIRPQLRKEKERQARLKALKKNDKVVTQGGMQGVVVQRKEPWVILKIDDSKDVRVKVLLSSIAGPAPGTEKPEETKDGK